MWLGYDASAESVEVVCAGYDSEVYLVDLVIGLVPSGGET